MVNGHNGAITGLSFNPKQCQLVTSSVDKSILISNLDEKGTSYRYSGHAGEVTDVCYSPNGRLIASASVDKTVRLWTVNLRDKFSEFKAHLSAVRSVHFSYDSARILTASDDKSLKIWSSSRMKFEMSLTGHHNVVRSAQFSKDGRRVVSCSDDKSTKLFDVSTGLCCSTFKQINGKPNKVVFHPGDLSVAVALSNGNVALYDIRSERRPLQLFKCHTDAVNCVSFDPSGKYLLTASADLSMKIVDLLESHSIYSIEGHKGAISVAGFSNDGTMIASGDQDGKLLVWNVDKEAIKICCCFPQSERIEISDKNNEVYQKRDPTLAVNDLKLIPLLESISGSLASLQQTVSRLERRIVNLEVFHHNTNFLS